MFDGIGEATWSYEKTFAGGHYVHRVSAILGCVMG